MHVRGSFGPVVLFAYRTRGTGPPPLATPYPHVPGLEEAGRRGFMTPFMNWQPTRSGVQKDLTSPLASNSAFLQEAGLFQRHGGEPHPICAHLLGLDENDGAEPRQIHL